MLFPSGTDGGLIDPLGGREGALAWVRFHRETCASPACRGSFLRS
jgi:hypothetical protein